MTGRELQLEAQLERALAENAELKVELAAAKAAIARLVDKLAKNSRNSSNPPSSDRNKPKTKNPKLSGRKRGAQPGHKRHERKIIPEEQVDKIINLIPDLCQACHHALEGVDENPVKHQIVEIPPIKPTIHEYRFHSLKCTACQATTRGAAPDDLGPSCYGDRLSAVMAICSAKYRLSKRSVKDLLSNLLGVELCIGSISKTEKRVSAALEKPHQEAVRFVGEQPVVHADETGWREDKNRAWLWVAATPIVAVFLIATGRGARAARKLLGDAFAGILVTDRWSAYNWVPTSRRQLCWAHLIRDFQSWVDREDEASHFGGKILALTEKMFLWWNKVKSGEISQANFADEMKPVRSKVLRFLRGARGSSCEKTSGMAEHILKYQKCLWTFVDFAGVEPTNNLAERTIRHGVIWRKTSFGTDSLQGSHFVERMLTAIATLRAQNRNVLEFVTEAVRARSAGRLAPSLLPLQDRHLANAA